MFQTAHAILPKATHDEAAREDFCASLRKMFTTELFPGARMVYSQVLLPGFERKHGRKPETAKEASDLLKSSFYYRASNAIGRAAQELVWETVGESVERQLPDLVERARPKPGALGSVRTNPEMIMPRYVDAVDIHVMPGNFHTELGEDDVFAGALYDRGVHVFAFGGLGEKNEQLGEAIAGWLKENRPEFQPRRILDIGCGPGFTTVAWKEAYPDAEVHGVDIGAPQVRYAHARAEAFGVGVHYSQQDGSATDFPDGHFDLVSSMLVTHEMPIPVIQALFAECHRLLAPGGITLHDSGGDPLDDPFELLMKSWFGNNANEPFSVSWRSFDFEKALVAAGFPPANGFCGTREQVYLKGQLPPISLVGSVRE
jgi:ubiquinone/menaquinone biosynthesis C-methylase UbiE